MILEGRNITKSYGEIEVLSDINIKVKSSEFYGISGPSGCGKTTLLSILALLDRADSGSLILKGRDISSLSREEFADIRNAQYGFIFQSYNMLMHLSVMENVLLPFEYGIPIKDDIEKKALLLLDRVGMKRYKDKKIYTLSGGEQQRVAIARALIRNPDIIFADEPTGNLDSKNSAMVLQLLQEIASQKDKSVIMVSHDMNALEYCTDVLVLEKQ